MDRLLSEKAVLEAILSEPTDAHYPSWYADKVRKLPTAKPQERTGKWIYWIGKDGFKRCKCSECNTSYGCIDTPYYPNCGCKMEVEHGSQDDRMHSK